MADGVYRASRTTWKYVIDLPADSETGKRRQESRSGFRTERAAKEARAARLVAIGRGVAVNPTQLTIGTFMHNWIVGRTNVRESTIAKNLKLLRYQIAPTLGAVPLGKLTPDRVARWQAQLLAHYAPSTVRNAHVLLSSALKQAVAWKMLPENVASLVPAPAVPITELRTWTVEQMAAFLEHGDRHPLALFWRLALITGMRRGELLALRWDDIDQKRATLAVQRTFAQDRNNQPMISPPKTRSSQRQIAFPAALLDLMRTHRRTQNEMFLFYGTGRIENSYVFARKDGRMLAPSTLQYHQRRLMDAAGVPRIPLHGFRHTAATLSLALGENPKIVQERLGHRSISTTLDRYSHVTESMQRDAAERIGAAIDALMEQRHNA